MEQKSGTGITILWALLSTLILFGFTSLFYDLEINFSGGYEPYLIRGLFVVVGHIIALITPFLIIRVIRKNQSPAILRNIMMPVVAVQIFYRWLAVALAHFDCGSSCAKNITPKKFDEILLLITAVSLVLVANLFSKRFGKTTQP